MIGWLRGSLHLTSSDYVLVEVGGVGYRVTLPASTRQQFSALPPGSEVTLHIHTHVREEALDLYGFATERELRLFEQLLQVSRIGPRLALAVISSLSPERLEQAVAQGDVSALARVPGFGKKTAERLLLELRDRMGLRRPARAQAVVPGSWDPGAAAGGDRLPLDALEALVGLGYSRPEAQEAVDRALRRQAPSGGWSVELLLREALRQLVAGPVDGQTQQSGAGKRSAGSEG